MNRTRKALVISPWLLTFVINLAIFLGHFLSGNVNLQYCFMKKSAVFTLLQAILIYLGPLTAIIVLNVLNIRQLQIKSRKTQKSNISTVMKTSTEVIHLSHNADSSESSSKKQVTVLDLNQGMSKRHARDRKALLCILALIVNILLTQYLTLILTLYFVFMETIYEWFVHLFIFSLELFPIFNPLIVFIFHESFRRDLINSFKKGATHSSRNSTVL